MKNKKNRITFRQFLGIFRGMRMPWLLMLLTVILQFSTYFVTIKVVYVTEDIIDTTGLFDSDTLFAYILTMIASSLLTVFGNPVQTMACEKINLGLRQRLWKKIIHLPQSHYAKDRGETLVSRITSDCDFASTLFVVIISSVTMVSGLVMYVWQMYQFHVLTASIVLLIFLPSSMLLGWIYGKLQYWVSRKNQKRLSDSTEYLVERTKNLNLIKTANMEDREVANGNRCFRAQYQVSIQQGLVTIFNFSIGTLLSSLTLIIAVVFGGMLIEKNLATAGSVIAFYLFAGQVSSTFSQFVSAFGSIRQAMGALERVVTTLEAPVEDLHAGEAINVPDEDIRFETIDFSYNDSAQILKQLSCLIEKKKVTAIIGSNGSGKTTMMKLLARLFEPDSGAIYFGERDIRDYSLYAWRKAVSIVSQDCPILEGTLRENILYGCDREVSAEELHAVARQANLEGLIAALPDGLDTYVYSGGANFSGGQRQCIAIARAMMRNPDYLLLDEATSNLDPRSERLVTDALHNLMKERTTVIIAHKLSALRYADRVIVVKDGQVSQSGTRKEVLPEWMGERQERGFSR